MNRKSKTSPNSCATFPILFYQKLLNALYFVVDCNSTDKFWKAVISLFFYCFRFVDMTNQWVNKWVSKQEFILLVLVVKIANTWVQH